jgi:hypothetical protein
LAALKSEYAALNATVSEMFTAEEVDSAIFAWATEEFAMQDYVDATLPEDQDLSFFSNNGRAERYDAAGFPIIEEYSPEPSFYLRNAHHDSLLRDMQGDVFQFPTTGNAPEDVQFPLPAPPAYSRKKKTIFKSR